MKAHHISLPVVGEKSTVQSPAERPGGTIIDITNIGAISNARIDIQPLTIFIGKNVTAKSYAATVVYALLNALSARRRIARARPLDPPAIQHSPTPTDETSAAFTGLIGRLLSSFKAGTLDVVDEDEDSFSIEIDRLTPADQELCSRIVQEMIATSADVVGLEISRCFGSDLASLITRRATPQVATIDWTSVLPSLQGKVAISATGVRGEGNVSNLGALRLTVPLLSTGHQGRPSNVESRALRRFAGITARDNLWDIALEAVAPRAHYLPAARSGIMHTHRLAAASWMEEAPMFGLRRVDVPVAAGTVLDFLAETILLSNMRNGPLHRVATQIEHEVLHGEIIVRKGATAYPDIIFKEGSEEFPLHLSSSMISEMAPLVLVVKYRLRPRELLIIEEPEAHLHPSAQVDFARAIAALVRADVRVLITTHSDFLLSELNNLIREGGVRKLQETPQADQHFLRGDEVAAFVFNKPSADSGVHAERLSVDPILGIPMSQIDDVVKVLHERSVQTERALDSEEEPSAR